MFRKGLYWRNTFTFFSHIYFVIAFLFIIRSAPCSFSFLMYPFKTSILWEFYIINHREKQKTKMFYLPWSKYISLYYFNIDWKGLVPALKYFHRTLWLIDWKDHILYLSWDLLDWKIMGSYFTFSGKIQMLSDIEEMFFNKWV